MSQEPSEQATRPRRKSPPTLFQAASLIALVTVLSKVLGALRDWFIMVSYGPGLATDAYFAAIQIPSFALILLGGLGGPFHTATIAVLGRMLKDPTQSEPDEATMARAKRWVATFLTLTGIGFAGLSVVAYLGAEPLFGLIFPGSDNLALVHAAAEHLRIMSPILFIGGIIGIFYGVLNLYHCYFWPSLSPGMMNVVMIGSLLIFPLDDIGLVLAWATVGGAVGQLVVQLPQFLRRGYTLKPSVAHTKTEEMKQTGEILFPAMLSTTMGQATVYVDMIFAGILEAGGWTAVVMANRLLQLPIGVLQTALLVPIFPRFTRWVAESNWEQLRRDFRLGVSALWFISLPILVILVFFVEPLIALVFQHGRFDAEATRMVSYAVLLQSGQMVAYFARDSLTRVFFAFQDSKTPFMVGVISIAIKAVLDYLLVVVIPLGVGGICLSTALISFINATLLWFLSRKHIDDLAMGPLLLSGGRLLGATAVMALLVWGTQEAFGTWVGDIQQVDVLAWAGRWAMVVPIGVSTLVGLAGYGTMCMVFQVEEAQMVSSRLLSRFRR